MPFGTITLRPGVDVEQTPTLNEAGIATSSFIRYRESLVQKYGGWQKFYNFAIAGTPRELHAWEDLNGATHLLAGTTTNLFMLSSGSIANISPQSMSTNNAPNFSTVANSTTVTIVDTGISGVTILDTVEINTPIAIGSVVISGVFPVVTALGGTSYNIAIATAAGTTVNNDGGLPLFTLATSSNLVNTLLTAHGLSTSFGGQSVAFQATTTIQNIVIFGNYPVTVVDANNFTLGANTLATSAATSRMNAGNANLQYFLTIGPSPGGAGYGGGAGGYGAGGYGLGTTGSAQTGSAITAVDWTSDNWGEIALACPQGGGIFQYDPTAGNTNAGFVSTAPPYNNGIFISNTLQILFAYGSTNHASIGQSLDPMLVRWSDIGDYTQFETLTTNNAGSFRIPQGSVIRGGLSMGNQNLFFTDLDVWSANFTGYPLDFGFSKIGAGAGLISSHAMQAFRGGVFWMGASNFYQYAGGTVSVIPCPVWDFVFQNLNTSFTQNVRSMPNTPFNEVGWLFPSSASSSGECDSYVKMNVTEPGRPWDAGSLPRSAWIDQTILGNPIAAAPTGLIYQHETTNDADGQPLVWSFTTGYFYIGEGEEISFVDQVLPDFKYGTYSGAQTAQISMTFNVINNPTDTPVAYGPYIITSASQLFPVRFRGRQVSVTIGGSDVGSFARLGKIRYRYRSDGRV